MRAKLPEDKLKKNNRLRMGKNILSGSFALSVVSSLAAGIIGLALNFALVVNSARAEVDIIDLRTGLHPDKTRVVLELSEIAYYRISYLDATGPDGLKQVIIDLRETPSRDIVASLAKKAAVIGVLDKITVEDHEGAVRLRISLRKAATVDNSFTLKPDHGLQYRLVFDLKAVSAAEWSRQVKLTAPPDPVPEPEPAPEPPVSVPPPPSVPLPPPVTPVEPVSVAPVTPEAETYDDMMTEDSNFTLSGYMEVEGRAFPSSSLNNGAKDWTVSFALEPLLEYISDTSSAQIMFRPFGRFDVNDGERSHFDIRELKWTGTQNRWQMTVGIDTIFWGVTESNHLVDIINQDDNLEDIDQEDKLGQPMVSVAYDSDFGVFSVYLMTYFREMRYPGLNGRLRLPLPVDYSQTQYQSGDGRWNMDWAVRWTHVIGNVDVGLYHFKGTSREAVFLAGTDGNGNGVFIPRYNLIDQTGLDLQTTFEDLLFKFEAIRRTGADQDFWAMTGGFEYTFYGLGGGGSDIGILAEYLYDDRGPQAMTPFEDDIFMGMRWAANDIDSTEILAGTILDLDTSAKFINIEGSRRIGDHWKVTLDVRFFLGIPLTDPIYPQSRDDFFQIRLARYF
ncbi:hypothetical protein MNBD_ALPHA01-2228 [hydrothermal vent metagenome]|uniref:AMIN domain-containing protein n=1 Tax=hydrothermal vent metagenome TaxID=652676 RepID=A0A3B0T3M3_9ZZZZ